MTKVMTELRYEIQGLMVVAANLKAQNPFGVGLSKESLYASGVMGELEYLGYTEDDVDTALREIVAIGHATARNGTYDVTQAGRDWYEAEQAVRQSLADAHERAAERLRDDA